MSRIFNNFRIFFFLSLFMMLQNGLCEKKQEPSKEPEAKPSITVCRSEVRYTWKPTGEAADSPGLDVSYAIVEARGDSEDAAKVALSRRVAGERGAASNRCRHTHENLAGCISTKYASMTSILNALSFGARGELEKAIAQDCGKQTGRCVSTASSEPECSKEEIATEAPEPAAAEEKK